MRFSAYICHNILKDQNYAKLFLLTLDTHFKMWYNLSVGLCAHYFSYPSITKTNSAQAHRKINTGVSPSGKAKDFDSFIVGSHTDSVGILRNAEIFLTISPSGTAFAEICFPGSGKVYLAFPGNTDRGDLCVAFAQLLLKLQRLQ